MRFTGLLTTLMAIGLTVASPGRAAVTVTMNPSADAFVDSAVPASNYGGAGALAVSAPLANGEFRSVIRFDVSTAVSTFNAAYGAGNWSLSDIKLSLSTTPPNNPLFNGYSPTTPANTAGLFGISWIGSDAWAEGNGTPSAASTTGGVTWNTLASFISGAESQGSFNYNPATSGLVPYTLTPTSGLLSDVMAGGLVSFYLTAQDSSVSALFASRTNSPASRPVLTLSAVPEPNRMMFLMIGGVTVWSRRRRQMALGDGTDK